MFSRKVSRLSNRDGQSTDCAGNSAVEGGQANRKGGQGDKRRHKENFFFPHLLWQKIENLQNSFGKCVQGKGKTWNLSQWKICGTSPRERVGGWWMSHHRGRRKRVLCPSEADMRTGVLGDVGGSANPNRAPSISWDHLQSRRGPKINVVALIIKQGGKRGSRSLIYQNEIFFEISY